MGNSVGNRGEMTFYSTALIYFGGLSVEQRSLIALAGRGFLRSSLALRGACQATMLARSRVGEFTKSNVETQQPCDTSEVLGHFCL